MTQYAILINPGHSRAYFEQAKTLSLAELQVVLQGMQSCCENAEVTQLAGISYVTFCAQQPLQGNDLAMLCSLSFAYAVFTVEDGLLRPVEKPRQPFIDESISSILKYSGKTNESFTRLLINLAAACCKNKKEPLRLLDPIAGKGTTLFEGLIRGYNVYGIEIGSKTVNEAYLYVRKFLETVKYKHTAATERISGENKSFTAQRYHVEIASDKQTMKTGARTLEMVAGNSQYAQWYFKKNFFDMIVGDLPYGVKHSNVTDEKQSGMTRNPSQLLYSCLPGWYQVLAPGGVVVLSWNTFLVPREKIAAMLEKSGFTVLQQDAFLQFKHRVDQAIRRDLIVAVKP